MRVLSRTQTFFFLLLTSLTNALELDVTNKDSICHAASIAADGLMDYYDGNRYGGVVGLFVQPYYWWAAGHAFGGLIDHWYLCHNDTYEELIWASMMHQAGENYDYVPSNQSTTEGNDDQGFWGFAVLEAAERNFTAPTGNTPDWLALSQAVYNTMWKRWDMDHCGGGLRWQIFTWNSGYDYKNTISQACLFQIAGRLARFTRNETYVDTAETVFSWMLASGLLVLNGDTVHVYDGANIGDNCSDVVTLEWTYNYGILIGGCAYLYDFTQDEVWLTRLEHLTHAALSSFFRNGIMYERACQDASTCNNDQRSFKAIFSRCLGMASLLVPQLADTIIPALEKNAQQAALSCSGGTDKVTCGFNWEKGQWDGQFGMGEQLAAMEVMLSLLTKDAAPPYSRNDTGVAVGNSAAGVTNDYTSLDHNPLTITNKDKAGGAVITAFILLSLVLGTVWMCI